MPMDADKAEVLALTQVRILYFTAMIGLLAMLTLVVVGRAAHAIPGKPMRFQRLSLEDGLSQATVIVFHQDSTGFMWVGTQDGLNRYDGYAFTIYRHDRSDPKSMPDNWVRDIKEDSEGNLWFGTTNGGLVRRDSRTGSYTAYKHNPEDPNSISSNFVYTLHLDEEGIVWVGTRFAGMGRFNPATGETTHYRAQPEDESSLSNDQVFTIVEDGSGSLWIGTEDGLNRLDPKTGEIIRYRHDPDDSSSLCGNRIRSIMEAADGVLWIATANGGLAALDRSRSTFRCYRNDPNDPTSLSHNVVRTLLEHDARLMWVGTEEGLNLMDRRTGRFRRYLHKPIDPTSLSGNQVDALYWDRNGLLWVGTRTGGISKWNPRSWSFGHYNTSLTQGQGLANPVIASILEARDGTLWLGTYGGGLDALDRNTGIVRHHQHDTEDPNSISDNRVMSLLQDREGQIWVGTKNGGLNLLDPETGKCLTYRNDPTNNFSIAANAISTLAKDRQGNIWIGTFGNGISRYRPHTDDFENYLMDQQSSHLAHMSNRIIALAADPRDMLWIGTAGGGLFLYDQDTGVKRNFKHNSEDPSSLSSDWVSALHLDSDGSFWIGTRGGGLDRVVGDPHSQLGIQFQNISQKDGLRNDVINGIGNDTQGRIWVSTDRGLSRYDPRSGRIDNYTVHHGLQSDNFIQGSHYQSASGELFFGGSNGINAFYPDRLETNRSHPPIALTNVLKMNQPVETGIPYHLLESIDLGWRDDVVTFEFTALDFAAPAENRYAYKLEGFDRDWVDIGTRRRVTYTNLDGGYYVFQVKASNNDGVWSEEGDTLALSVAAPPWKTWWAYTIYATLILMIKGIIYRTQQHKLAHEAEYSRRLEKEVALRTKELAEINTQLHETNEQLQELSLTDQLTGLRNRRYLRNIITEEVAHIERHYLEVLRQGLKPVLGSPNFMFVMIDLDGFKPINDTYGHAAGDRVLIEVKNAMQNCCRKVDTIVRWGGDEFLIACRDCDPAAAETLVGHVHRTIQELEIGLDNGQNVTVGCSLGYAFYPFIAEDPALVPWGKALAIADKALYIAKESGKNTWAGIVSNGPTLTTALIQELIENPTRLIAEGAVELCATFGSVPVKQHEHSCTTIPTQL